MKYLHADTSKIATYVDIIEHVYIEMNSMKRECYFWVTVFTKKYISNNPNLMQIANAESL